jgi:hypothetical protein
MRALKRNNQNWSMNKLTGDHERYLSMLSNWLMCQILLSVLVIAGSSNAMSLQQNRYKGYVLNAPVGESTAVRLFYDPALSDAFRFPIILRVTEEGDARLVNPPSTRAGWTSYITFSEMRQFLRTLAQSNLIWQESGKVEIFEPALQILRLDTMEIAVVGSIGTAKAMVRPKGICQTLEPLDATLKTKRAIWELQRFRLSYGCQVPGFDWNQYPDRN